ncbi:MAG: hypothetical protein R2715_08210 [Ilumatobacteraceae bacterium]
MSRGLVHHIVNHSPGIQVTAIYNRTLSRAGEAYRFADQALEATTVNSSADLDAAIASGRPAITDDPTS